MKNEKIEDVEGVKEEEKSAEKKTSGGTPMIAIVAGILFAIFELSLLIDPDTYHYPSQAENLGVAFGSLVMMILGLFVAYWGYKQMK